VFEDDNSGLRTARKGDEVDKPDGASQRPPRAGDLSRRDALGRLGAGGLFPIAAALLARSLAPRSVAAAQDTPPAETPMAPESGVLPGVEVTTLTAFRFEAAPPTPFDFIISRAILEPGASFPVAAGAGDVILFIEEGVAICPGDGGRIFIGRDLTTREVGAGEVVLAAGEALFMPAGVADGLRVDGPDRVVEMEILFQPVLGAEPAST
jgi:hypothetical protein